MTRRGRLDALASALKPITAHGAALLAAAALAAVFPASGFTDPGDGSESISQIDVGVYVPEGPEPAHTPPTGTAPALPAPVDGVGTSQAAGGEADSATGATTPPASPQGTADGVHAGSGAADDQRPAYAAKAGPGYGALPAGSITAASPVERPRSRALAHQVASGGPVRAAGDEPDAADPPGSSGCAFVPMGQPVTQGTPRDDLIIGTPGNDLICGFGGNDTIDGRGGDDRIDGGEGNDRIDGGEGDDCLLGGNGDDYVSGGKGGDLTNGGNGNIMEHGSSGDEQTGGPGRDILTQPGTPEGEVPTFVFVTPGGKCGMIAARSLSDTVEDTAGFFASGVRRLAGTEEAEAATPPAPLTVNIVSRSVTLEGGFASVEVACSGPFLRADGTLTLTTNERIKGRRRKLGTEPFACRPFTPTLVEVSLSAADRRLVRQERRMQVRGRVSITDLAGRVAKAQAVLSLRAPRR